MDRPDSNIPQAPEGYSRPESSLQNVAGSSNQNGGKPRPFEAPTYKQGFVLCVVGGVITGLLSFIGAALVAYGMVIAVYCKKGHGWFGPAITSVLITGVAAYLLSGPTEAATSVTACALALGVGYAFATEKLTVGVGSLLVGATALALLGIRRVLLLRWQEQVFPSLLRVCLINTLRRSQVLLQRSKRVFQLQRHSLMLFWTNQLYRHGAFILCNCAFLELEQCIKH